MSDSLDQNNRSFALRLIYGRSVDPMVIYTVENFCEEIRAVVRENTQDVYWKDENCFLWELSCDCDVVPMEVMKEALCKHFSIQPTCLEIHEDGSSVELAYYPTEEDIHKRGKVFLVMYIPKGQLNIKKVGG